MKSNLNLAGDYNCFDFVLTFNAMGLNIQHLPQATSTLYLWVGQRPCSRRYQPTENASPWDLWCPVIGHGKLKINKQTNTERNFGEAEQYTCYISKSN